jgi:tetratricopeptide (TPR) repeat protein
MLRYTIVPILTLVLCSINQYVSFAQQKSVNLDPRNCVSNSWAAWKKGYSNISINKQVISPLFETSTVGLGWDDTGLITCQVNPPKSSKKFKVINLGFGVTGQHRTDAIITLYLDGKEVFSKRISPDDSVSFSVDISQAKDLAIETQSPSGSRQRSQVVFFEASLYTDSSTLLKALKDQGDTQYEKEEYQEAVVSYTSAIILSPRYAALYYNRGISYQFLGNYKLAYKDLEEAVQLYKEQGRMQDYQDASKTRNEIKKLINSETPS